METNHAEFFDTEPVIVNVTNIFDRMADVPDWRSMVTSYVVAPPWENAAFGYAVENCTVIGLIESAKISSKEELPQIDREGEPEPIDLDKVHWVLTIGGYAYGKGKTSAQHYNVYGPFSFWRVYVDKEGKCLGTRLHHPHKAEFEETIEWSLLYTVFESLNFLNCRNVDIVEPTRDRAERKRLARLNVNVNEIVVYPKGKSTKKTDSKSVNPIEIPLTSVRGHFAEYGQNGKGLLFGKYAGRFWIPQHARGDAAYGESRHTYTLEPD